MPCSARPTAVLFAGEPARMVLAGEGPRSPARNHMIDRHRRERRACPST
jgi:hypothetical protein